MARSLRDWIERAEELDSLERIDEEVHWDEEMSTITYMAHRREEAPALLFENITDYPDGRVLFNIFSSSARRIALTLEQDPNFSEKELIKAARDRFGNRIEPTEVFPKAAPVYENTVTGEEIDLYEFPTPKMWPLDGGRFIGTADTTVSRNEDTGHLNVGTYRQMIHSANETGIFLAPGKDLRLHMEDRWERDEPLEIAAAYGVQPAVYMASGLSFAKDASEYEYAGGLRGEAIEVVEGEVTGLPIPANAEIVAEGRIYPDDMLPEGSFGEFTGFYGSERDERPVITVEALHYRDDPILTAALMADYPGCDINLMYSVGRSARIWDDLDQWGIPGIEGVYAHPAAGSGFMMTVVSIDQQHAGHTSQVASLVAQCPSAALHNKVIVAVDDDVDPTDINQVLWAMATRFNPEDDIDVLTDTWGTTLDPSRNPEEERPYGSKALIDATIDHQYYDEFPQRVGPTEEMYDRVVKRWEELDLEGSPPDLPFFVEPDESELSGGGADDDPTM
jgi:4-hydroxy-3-polyprenylbenzoate decarboxylase